MNGFFEIGQLLGCRSPCMAAKPDQTRQEGDPFFLNFLDANARRQELRGRIREWRRERFFFFVFRTFWPFVQKTYPREANAGVENEARGEYPVVGANEPHS